MHVLAQPRPACGVERRADDDVDVAGTPLEDRGRKQRRAGAKCEHCRPGRHLRRRAEKRHLDAVAEDVPVSDEATTPPARSTFNKVVAASGPGASTSSPRRWRRRGEPLEELRVSRLFRDGPDREAVLQTPQPAGIPDSDVGKHEDDASRAARVVEVLPAFEAHPPAPPLGVAG